MRITKGTDGSVYADLSRAEINIIQQCADLLQELDEAGARQPVVNVYKGLVSEVEKKINRQGFLLLYKE